MCPRRRSNLPTCLWSKEAVESIARVFTALGEPMRLRLLDALSTGERSVNELVVATGTSQPNVSKHLSVLVNAGLVRRRKDGAKVCCSVAGETPLQLIRLMQAKVRREFAQRVKRVQNGQSPLG